MPVEPSPTASPPPPPSPTPTGSATSAEPTPRDPTDTDRARYVASYRPGGTSSIQEVAADVDGDGQKELVFAYVVDAESRSRVDVADWTGTRYEIVSQHPGGPADDLVDLRVRDVTADGAPDVVISQTLGTSSASLTLWATTSDATLRPLTAEGGCFDGSNTYGDTSAELANRDDDPADEIAAVCEDPDLPQPLWPSEIYDHDPDVGTYVCAHRETAEGLQLPCGNSNPQPDPSRG